MTKRRQLSAEEKALVSKNIEFLEEELKFHQVMIEQLDLTIKNADVLVKKQIRDKKAERNHEEETIREHTNAINVLKDQVKNGVEEKNAK
jgi:hypothetical protein